MVKACLGGLVEAERGDAGTRLLFAQGERVIRAEHHPVHAAGVEQVAQGGVVGDSRAARRGAREATDGRLA